MKKIGNSRYAKTDFGEFFYLNSNVDTSLLLLRPRDKRYNVLVADDVKDSIWSENGYFKTVGDENTKKIVDLSRIYFVDSKASQDLLKMQEEYGNNLRLIISDEVDELLELQKIKNKFIIESGIPLDVYNELLELKKNIEICEGH